MDTAALRNFATSARRQLIEELSASLSAVMAPGSLADREHPNQYNELTREISSVGRDAVVERLSYVWFNRLIALRFLDARRFTRSAVVSPAGGALRGQPEILANAKRGIYDISVFDGPELEGTKQRIEGLLSGTVPSSDRQSDAYALLLEAYCDFWAKLLPGVFQEAADYSRLVFPGTLLSPNSVMNQALEVLTPESCEDVEIIGWLYQFYISERKGEVFAGFKKNHKAGAAEIPPATQLFTPDWIVRYLVENSLGRLWMLNHPDSDLASQMEYYLPPVSAETDFLRISRPEEIKVIDPCVGSGHMLTYAFDLLYQIYEELGYEPGSIPGLILKHNLVGLEIDPRAAGLAQFALSMKARQKVRTFFDKKHTPPRISVVRKLVFTPSEVDLLTKNAPPELDEFLELFRDADVLGSLIQPDREQVEVISSWVQKLQASPLMGTLDFSGAVEKLEKAVAQAKYLADSYTICVTNPPYMGSSNMGSVLKKYVNQTFPDGKFDLFSAFIFRIFDLVERKGQMGFMAPFVWMFISSYQKLREHIVNGETLTSLIQLEYSGFDGATVPICTFTIERGHHAFKAPYIRLADFVGADLQGPKALEIIQASKAIQENTVNPYPGMEKHLYRRDSSAFAAIPGMPLAYWLSEAMQRAFSLGKPLGEVAAPRQGLATSDNQRFLRYWFEVDSTRTYFHSRSREEAEESGRKWFPYNKGGEFRKWWGNQEFVVNWENEGDEIRHIVDSNGKVRSRPQNTDCYFQSSVSWSKISSGSPAFRVFPPGFIFDVAGTSIFTETERLASFAAVCNSRVTTAMLAAVSPTLNFEVGTVAGLPLLEVSPETQRLAQDIIDITRKDWDFAETSWDFAGSPLLADAAGGSLQALTENRYRTALETTAKVQELETEVNREVAQAYGLETEIGPQVPLADVTLTENPYYRYKPTKDLTRSDQEYHDLFVTDAIKDLVSYAVGCMFGRYSLDKPGLILADARENQDAHLAAYHQAVGGDSPRFAPDADGVIPVLDSAWFDDDIAARFKKFLKVVYGQEQYDENLRFVCEALEVKEIKDYFLEGGKSKFFADHVKRYKSRPIYWLFSSPKGTFNALVYVHRYTPDTIGLVEEYLRSYIVKLEAEMRAQERSADVLDGVARNKVLKRVEQMRRDLIELHDYDSSVLYPLATHRLPLDLDDGVLVNYLRMGEAVTNFGLEKKRREVEGWKWPKYPLERQE